MKDTMIAIIVLSLLVAVFSVYGPQVASERTGGNWLMASMRSPGSTPGKGEGEGDGESPVSFLFTPGEATKGTAQPEENTGSGFSLTVTVEKVKEQVTNWQIPTLEIILCVVAAGSVMMQTIILGALVAAWVVNRRTI